MHRVFYQIFWRSRLAGRGRMIGNHVNVKAFRGFESLLLRQRDAGPNLFRVQRYFLFIARQIRVASFLVPVYTPAVSNSHIAGFSFLQQICPRLQWTSILLILLKQGLEQTALRAFSCFYKMHTRQIRHE